MKRRTEYRRNDTSHEREDVKLFCPSFNSVTFFFFFLFCGGYVNKNVIGSETPSDMPQLQNGHDKCIAFGTTRMFEWPPQNCCVMFLFVM